MQQDVVDAEHRALAVVEEQPPPQAGLALFTGEPDEVIMRAVKVADALKSVITQKGLVKKIQGREFIEVAGWQTLGSLVGVTTSCDWTRRTEDPNGWEARVVVLRNGVQIGAAEAQCTRDEKAWSNRDEYALRSMSQTRATSKALRSVLGFIAVIAGYEDTPAAEVPPGGFDNTAWAKAPSSSSAAPPAQDRDEDTAENRDRWRKQIAIGCTNRGVSREQRQEIAEAFFGQWTMREDPAKADPPNASARLTAAQLHLLYKLLARMIGERNRLGDAFRFDEWLADARAKYAGKA